MSEDEQVPRPSRYRSLRKQTISAPGSPNATRTASGNRDSDQQHGNAAGSSISRSMSRYRRRAASVTADTDNHVTQTMNSGLDNAPPVPAIPPSLKPAMTGGHDEHMVESSAQRQLRHTETQRRTIGQTTDEGDNHSKVTCDSNRGQKIMSGRSIQNGPLAPRDVSWEEERERLLEEQKRKDLQRLEEELESSRRAKAQSHKIRSPVVEKFMALAKGNKNSNDGMSPASPMATSARSSAPRRSDREPVKTLPAHIEPGGKGIVPQKDAPTSAINAGGRNVAVRYRHHTFSLPITPETTAVDIITQTSSKTVHDAEISPERCLVVEQYSILGLERRLRRYERIRDVMNSWDSDAQNQLAIVLPDTHENHEDLLVSSVAKGEEPPSGCQLHMYHSNRPGKWNKRWITLLQSGQIVCAKKPNAKTTDKDTASLCHLSDYDIYTPTESQMRRHIKPPKRFCFAIKSQHKTTLFLNTDNYVQYFSTEDPSAAHEFKLKAHSWRSWYLVGRNPEERKKTSSGARTEDNIALESPSTKYTLNQPDSVAAADGQRLRVSIDESPYSIGQFEPLLDMKRFDKRLSQFGKEVPMPQSEPPSKQIVDQKIRRRLSKREKPDSRQPQVLKRESEEGFTGGLLGDGYDNRKQALADLEKKKRPQELAFTEGASLLNSPQDPELAMETPESPSWFPSAQEHTAKQRTDHQTTAVRPLTSGNIANGRHFSLNAATHRPTGLVPSAARSSTQHSSQHTSSRTQTQPHPHPNPLKSQPTGLPHSDRNAPSKPLVDLTPTFQEPPQWSKDKKGHGVKPPEGLGHLVDFISVGNGTDSTSNRSIIRRPITSGSAPLGRTRSMSAATSSGRPLLDDIPPVPVLPSRLGLENEPHSRRPAGAPVARDGRVERRETVSHKEREQEKVRHRGRERDQRDREYREREAAYNAVPGRTGTLKVV